jgi:hypothetical protein
VAGHSIEDFYSVESIGHFCCRGPSELKEGAMKPNIKFESGVCYAFQFCYQNNEIFSVMCLILIFKIIRLARVRFTFEPPGLDTDSIAN